MFPAVFIVCALQPFSRGTKAGVVLRGSMFWLADFGFPPAR